MAFSNVGVALVHALEYPIGGATHCSHGAGNGLLLPYVMRYNKPVRVERMARIARFLGEETAGLSPDEAAEAAIAAVERLRRDIGIPQRLSTLGVRADQLQSLAEKAFTVKRILRVNPRVPTVEDMVEILRSAL
jgi:alcohol dehydrogenase class IV